MFNKTACASLFAAFALAGCASDRPQIIQASTDATELRLSKGMATQIEMPDQGRVQSVTVGDPDLVRVDQGSDVVSLVAKVSVGETNLIIRSRDEDNHIHVYQYHLNIAQ